MNYTKLLATTVQHITYDDLSEKALEAAKKVFIDWMALALAGSRERSSQLLQKVLLPSDGGYEATLWSAPAPQKETQRMCSALQASFLNGAASHALDFDDLHNKSIIHLATVTVPAALAVAEVEDVSGKDFLTAIVAAYELGARVGESIQPDSYHFWHTTGTVGALTSAVAAGHLMKLTDDEMVQALGSAGTQASGLWDFVKEGAMSKPLHAGKACYNGLLAALLAKEGFTASSTILEGEKGFCRAMMEEPRWDALHEGLGQSKLSHFKIEENSFKPYPCCKHSHSSLYGIDQWRQKLGLAPMVAPPTIEKITLYVNAITDSLINNPQPLTPYGAKFSIQYCVATMALYGHVALVHFKENALHDEAVRALMERIEVIVDEGEEAAYVADPSCLSARIALTYVDGAGELQEYILRIPVPKGDPGNTLTMVDMSDKAFHLLEPIYGKEKSEAFVEKLNHVEEASSMKDYCRELFEILQ